MSRASRATERSFRKAARRIKDFADDMEGVTANATRQIGEEVMTDVKASRQGRGVPVDTGTLRSTARVTGPNRKGEVRLSFGGPAAPYAIVQHEEMHLHHDVGEARYLVRGLERWGPDGSAAMKALRRQALEAAAFGGTITAGGSFPAAPLQ